MLNLSQIYMVIPTKEEFKLLVESKELAEKTKIHGAAYQIEKYHLKPHNKKGIDLFNHMIKSCNNNNK